MSVQQPVKLLLVDDHPIVRSGLRMLFLSEPSMTIVGEADSGEAAVAAVQRLKPDVVIMDVAMPGMNGIEATRRIKAAHPETAVLALTMYEDEQYFFEMLNAGASGYIPKRAAPDDLVSAIKVVAEGNVFLYSTLARFLIKDMAERSAGGEAHGVLGSRRGCAHRPRARGADLHRRRHDHPRDRRSPRHQRQNCRAPS